MIKSKEKIKELPGDCTVIFKCNINDRYIDHSVCGNFACLKNVLLVKFASCYYKKSISEKDCQPDLLKEDISDEDIDFPVVIPKKNTLKNIHEVILEGIRGYFCAFSHLTNIYIAKSQIVFC